MFYLRVHFTKDYDDLEKLEEKYKEAKEAGAVLVVGTNSWEIVCEEEIAEEIEAYCKKSKGNLFVEGLERLAPYVIVDPHREEGPPIVTHIEFLDEIDAEKLECGLEINPTEGELWEAWEKSVLNGAASFPYDQEVLDLFDCHEEDCEGGDDCECDDYVWEEIREKFSFQEAFEMVQDNA